jgi:hypothetical protein
MNVRKVPTLLSCLALCLAATWPAVAEAAPRSARFARTLRTTITEPGRTAWLAIDLTDGARLSLSVLPERSGDLVPTLRLIAPGGAEFAAVTADPLKRARRARIDDVLIAAGAAGTWFVAVVGDDGTTGDFILRVRGRHPHRERVRGLTLGPDATATIPFTGLRRSRLSADLRPRSGSIAGLRVLLPSGDPVSDTPRVRHSRSYDLELRRVPLRGGIGRYSVEVTAGPTGLVLDADLRVSSRRRRARAASKLVIPEGFDFTTTRPVELGVEVKRDDGTGLPYVGIDVLTEDDERIATGVTDQYGGWYQTITLPKTAKLLRLRARTIGLATERVLPVSDALHVVFE